jgi:hypothetical protein
MYKQRLHQAMIMLFLLPATCWPQDRLNTNIKYVGDSEHIQSINTYGLQNMKNYLRGNYWNSLPDTCGVGIDEPTVSLEIFIKAKALLDRFNDKNIPDITIAAESDVRQILRNEWRNQTNGRVMMLMAYGEDAEIAPVYFYTGVAGGFQSETLMKTSKHECSETCVSSDEATLQRSREYRVMKCGFQSETIMKTSKYDDRGSCGCSDEATLQRSNEYRALMLAYMATELHRFTEGRGEHKPVEHLAGYITKDVLGSIRDRGLSEAFLRKNKLDEIAANCN